MGVLNEAEFNKALTGAMNEISEEEAPKFLRKVGKKLFIGIVTRTPVRTGLAKGNWHVTLNNPSDEIFDTLDPDGSVTINAGLEVISQFGVEDDLYINNNIHYVPYLDAGISLQAPAGMVVPTLAEIAFELKHGN